MSGGWDGNENEISRGDRQVSREKSIKIGIVLGAI